MSKLKRSLKISLYLALVSCLLLACTITSRISSQERQPTPIKTMTPEATQQELFSLPAPLYYLQDGQIWRLDPDAQTIHQVTSEDAVVEAFDISPMDGSLAYISNNNLVVSDPDGGNQEILLAGAVLPPLLDELTRLNEMDHITSAIRSPYWSEDGQKIAFINNGLLVYDLEKNQVEPILTYTNNLNEQTLLADLFSWSSDGQYFLVSQYAYPIESLHQIELGLFRPDNYLYNLSESYSVTFTWNPETTLLILANAAYGSPQSLQVCELANMECTLIAEFEPARWYYHYAHPFVTAEDKLFVFMGTTDDGSQIPDTFKLISLHLDGSNRQNLRNDGYSLATALWSPNGDGIVVVLADETGNFPTGSMVWLAVTDAPPVSLPVMLADNLRWDLSNSQ